MVFAMPRKVILPTDIANSLHETASIYNEIIGVALYRKEDDYCLIDTFSLTGVGDSFNASDDPARLAVLNRFLKLNPSYGFIHTHTHSKGTIRDYGEHVARGFSGRDMQEIEKNIAENRDYMAMLITPEGIALEGYDDPQLIVTDFPHREKEVQDALKIIANEMGYKLSGIEVQRA